MPSSRYFDRCPPFPTTAAAAELPIIALSKLEDANTLEEESLRLFDACRQHGFFLVDLRHSTLGQALLRDAENMFDLTAQTLNLDKATLARYAYNPPKDLLGYKEAGKLKTDDGKFDATEMYTLGQDDMIGTVPSREDPETIQTRRSECKDFFQRAYLAVAVILCALDGQLGLPRGTLMSLSSQDKMSATSLRLLLTRPQEKAAAAPAPLRVTLGAHTDIGLVTLLFHVAGGLQILPANCENIDANWRYVRPELGCALMNLGDTLVEWTGGLLRSSLHRVVTAPGDQNSVARVSLAYLVRPAHGESMKRLRGERIPLLADGEEEDNRTVDEWAAERATQIMTGMLRPRTIGGA